MKIKVINKSKNELPFYSNDYAAGINISADMLITEKRSALFL